ncbi:II/X family phage/plasmid replication protein [Paraburkholderia sp. GAS33]|uniref:phage/plasmid replication protein, II/X family n=1 Tax=Paraburkholderia sp. GAS33 TaxID=3035130 RepID=UPI003D1AF281
MKEIYNQILPENFQVNIDTVEFSIDEISLQIHDALISIITTPDGEILQTRTNRKSMPATEYGPPLQFRYKSRPSLSTGELFVEGSPYAHLYGQNVWTSDSVQNATAPIIKLICKFLKTPINKSIKSKLTDGKIKLHRIDLAVNFQLESENHVNSAITQLKHLLASQGCQSHLHQRYVALAPKGSKYYMISAYAKGSQMRINKNLDTETHQRLVRACEPLLRIEVRLRSAELRKLGLAYVSDWTDDTAREVFRKYFHRLPLEGISFGTISEEDFKNVDDRMRPIVVLHKLGFSDWHLAYSEATRTRHKAYFRQRGINLDCPTQADAETPLVTVLVRKGAISPTPAWLVRAGMAPKRRR